MSTKKIILIFGILVVIALAIVVVMSSDESVTDNTNGFSVRNFFPFGNPEDQIEVSDSTTSAQEQMVSQDTSEPIPKLRKISSDPVAGAVIFSRGTTTIVRFVLKDTGNVYEATSDSLAIKRLTNTTIPKINRSFWLPSGEGFLAQKTDGSLIIETSYIRLKPTNPETSSEFSISHEAIISDLPTGIKEVTPSPDSKKIFYYTADSGMRAFISNPDGTNSVSIYSGPISEWVPNWFSKDKVLLVTKSSSESNSYGYLLNIPNKSLIKVFGNIIGSSALPNENEILISSGGVEPSLSLITNKGSIEAIGAKTLVEKCDWLETNSLVCAIPKRLSRGSYPDDWYRGTLVTDDVIELLDIKKNSVLIISDLKDESGEQVDVQNIQISKDGDYALFVNKINQSLWLLRLE